MVKMGLPKPPISSASLAGHKRLFDTMTVLTPQERDSAVTGLHRESTASAAINFSCQLRPPLADRSACSLVSIRACDAEGVLEQFV